MTGDGKASLQTEFRPRLDFTRRFQRSRVRLHRRISERSRRDEAARPSVAKRIGSNPTLCVKDPLYSRRLYLPKPQGFKKMVVWEANYLGTSFKVMSLI